MPDDLTQVAAQPSPATERLAFRDAFQEGKDETLTLSCKLKIKGQDIDAGVSFAKGEKIAGVDFHVLRYLDLAVKPLGEGYYEITGFFPPKP